MANTWPRQDIPETDKNLQWYKDCLDYGLREFYNKQKNHTRIAKMRNSYNGIIDKSKIRYLTHTFGKKIKTKFVDYRLGRPKIDLVNGEWLKRKLSCAVRSSNRDAVSEKLDKYYSLLGLQAAQGELRRLRDIIGFDAYEGMEIPPPDKKIDVSTIKTENEKYMEHVLREFVRKYDVKTMLSKNFKDVELASECCIYVDIQPNGHLTVEYVLPEDAVFQESDGDDFLERSPFRGHRRRMFIHDILALYSGDEDFTDTVRGKLNEMRDSPSRFYSSEFDNRRYYQEIDNNLAIDVFRLEWPSSRPVYTKVSKNHRTEISPEYYEENEKKIQRDVRNGKFQLIKEWKIELHEATQIGHDIFLRCRRKPYQMRSADPPHDPISSYTNLLFNTEQGIRVSLQEMVDNISFLYNVTMFQINREISKSKGKVLYYDLAYLPRGKTLRDVMHNLTDDSVIIVNSAKEGNKYARDLDVSAKMIKELDLSLSNTVGQLINLKMDLQNMVDKLTGIPQDREGQIQASSTVTNAQSNIIASRTMTEPMFYYMERFVEKFFTKVLESLKVGIGLLGSTEFDAVLGEKGKTFLRATKDLMNNDFSAHLLESSEEIRIRETLDVMAQVSVNARQLRVPDWLKSRLSETLSEAQEALEQGWQTVEQMRLKSAEIRAKSNKEKMEMMRQMAVEDREDQQRHDVDMELLRQGAKGVERAEKGEQQLIQDQNKLDQQPEKIR